MSELTPMDIQEINRKIAAGTYEHKENKPKPRRKPRIAKPKPEEGASDD